MVLRIIAEHPGINGKQITALAKELGVSRNKVCEVLSGLPSESGNGRERRYYPRQAVPAEQAAA